MTQKIIIKKNSFYDSVALMTVSKNVKALDGIKDAVVVMATDFNKELLKNVKFMDREVENASPADLIIALRAKNQDCIDKAVSKIEELLDRKTTSGGQDYEPPTLESALFYMPDANIVLISLPGMYAANEAEKALKTGRHVMLFSDNVSLEDEIRLKKIAQERQLLMMGPDCGTSIINGTPLAFANKVPRGKIGIVAASGTGSQEVSCIIARLGGGISQLIGTGGRDLTEKVGGIMMTMVIKSLLADPNTEVIVLLSKPPSKTIMEKILAMVKTTQKKFLVHFIGANHDEIRGMGLVAADTLEETAYRAYEMAYSKKAPQADKELNSLKSMGIQEGKKLNTHQKYIRGLYSGGSLCDEALVIMKKHFEHVYSNTPLTAQGKLPSSNVSLKHTVIDLGDDEFTRGKPHPMIDFSTREERLLMEANDIKTAVILMDVVIGYGAHKDPARELVPYIAKAKEIAEKRGDHLPIVISLCGTYDDPQDYIKQKQALEEVGAIVSTTNAGAVKTAIQIAKRGEPADKTTDLPNMYE